MRLIKIKNCRCGVPLFIRRRANSPPANVIGTNAPSPSVVIALGGCHENWECLRLFWKFRLVFPSSILEREVQACDRSSSTFCFCSWPLQGQSGLKFGRDRWWWTSLLSRGESGSIYDERVFVDSRWWWMVVELNSWTRRFCFPAGGEG